jgi:hypothetical protein
VKHLASREENFSLHYIMKRGFLLKILH